MAGRKGAEPSSHYATFAMLDMFKERLFVMPQLNSTLCTAVPFELDIMLKR